MEWLRRITGALVILVGLVVLILIRIFGSTNDFCEYDPSFNLKGTFADCNARNAAEQIPQAEKQALAAR